MMMEYSRGCGWDAVAYNSEDMIAENRAGCSGWSCRQLLNAGGICINASVAGIWVMDAEVVGNCHVAVRRIWAAQASDVSRKNAQCGRSCRQLYDARGESAVMHMRGIDYCEHGEFDDAKQMMKL